MDARDLDAGTPPGRSQRDLVLQSPPNWTAVIFFACLACLHLSIALPAFYRHRWEGYVSLLFAVSFITVTCVAVRSRFELAILPRQRVLMLRRGTARFHFQRCIPFADVHAVRLMASHPTRGGRGEARVEIICDGEDIECPPTRIPRQEALYLAILLGVRLIKVSDHEAPEPSEAEPEFVSRF